MKKVMFTGLLLSALTSNAQVTPIDSLKEIISNQSETLKGIDERLSGISGDVAGLKKLKITGSIQAQYDVYDYDSDLGVGSTAAVGTTPAIPLTNTFFIRRARVKFTYEPTDGVTFVLQPNFNIDRTVSLRDAYVKMNDQWLKTLSLTMGQFNRINYEIEESSATAALLERSRMVAIIYPSQRELGIKVEANLEERYKLPLKLQLAVFNGNNADHPKDADNQKDVMARATYDLKLPETGLDINFGVHGYVGSNRLTANGVYLDKNNKTITGTTGTQLDKRWFGVEAQVYYDWLGGISLKTEYISGINSSLANSSAVNSIGAINLLKGERNFAGCYITLAKNVGDKNQFAARFDSFDPNTNLSSNSVNNAADLKYDTWTFSWTHFYTHNLKLVLGYELPTNETSTNPTLAAAGWNKDKIDNTLSLRIQAKF